MQTPTLSFLTSSSRTSWRILLTLLTLFAGVSTALAQYDPGTSTVTMRNALVTYGSATSSSTGTFDASSTNSNSANGPTSAGIFNNTDFGTYDVNIGRLLLQGGTIEVQEANGETYNNAYITYGVAPGTLTSTSPVLNKTLQLVQTGYTGNTRTFALSNGAIDILALATTTGAQYRFDISVTTTGLDATGNDIILSGSRRRSVFTPTGTISTASISTNSIQIAADGAPSTTSYYFPNTGTTPQFPSYNFTSTQNAGNINGAFDINNGQLRLQNTVVTTTETGSNTITSVILYYRTRTPTGGGAFQPITLTQSGSPTSGTRTFIIDPTSANNTNSQPNLIATPAVTATGNYIVEIYYQANVYNSSTQTTSTVNYPPNGSSSPFAATFTVGGQPIATTIWTGAINDNWFDPGNWSAGVPSATTNALVRDLGAGNSVPYPNIYSNTVRTTASGAVLYDNTNSGPAQTLNFTLGGSSQASRSIARLVVGQLQVFGNFDNSFDSYIQRESTITEFAGGNQTITGGSFIRVDISGGGTKKLLGLMNISESLNFLTPGVYTKPDNPLAVNPVTPLTENAGILSTDIKQPATNLVSLADRATTNFNNGAQLNGETDLSFLYGFVRTTRQGVLVNETRTYGNLGMTLTFTDSNSPGNVEVTRNTVEAYAPGPNRFGVRRIFGVRPSDQATNSGGLVATMVFRYRDAETVNLNGPDTITPGSGSIPEQDLTIFVSSNSGNTFQLIGRDGPVDQTNNTITRTGVTTFATFTLGDINFPLPVVLTAFNAVRSGNNTLLTWATASESNSKGFEVQLSADGTAFRTLGFVGSETPSSTQAKTYKYVDMEAGKVNTRYYRLHQVDLDGKESYSPVRAVNFDGTVAAVALSTYPNPFVDKVDFDLDASTLGTNGIAQVQLLDMTGRVVREQNLTVQNASLTLNNLSGLRSGLYMARITLPDGGTKTVRIQKQ